MNSFKNSWEEQAFAEDVVAAGPLGGFVWPPRSYSCTFCRREFRSAQALGGHMNVHRRDRARLKTRSLIQNEKEHETPSTLLPGTQHLGQSSYESSIRDLGNTTHVETNLSMGQIGGGNKETIKSKRHKRSDHISSFAFFQKPCLSDIYVIKTNGLEDIDLELRLGDSPPVK